MKIKVHHNNQKIWETIVLAYCCNKSSRLKNLAKRVISSYSLLVHHSGKSGQEPKAGIWRLELMRGHGGVLLSGFFLST